MWYVLDSRYRKGTYLRDWLNDQVKNPTPELLALAASIPRVPTNDELIVLVLQRVKGLLTYLSDNVNPYHAASDYWQTAQETMTTQRGDCEDGAILIYLLARLCGISSNQLMLWAGSVIDPASPGKTAGHCCLLYRPANYPLNWCFMDWCYWSNNFPVSTRTLYQFTGSRVVPCDPVTLSNYLTTWFGFNETKTTTTFNMLTSVVAGKS